MIITIATIVAVIALFGLLARLSGGRRPGQGPWPWQHELEEWAP